MLQGAEQRAVDARQKLAAVEQSNDTCQPRASQSAKPGSHVEPWQRSSSHCCNAAAISHDMYYPDIQQTSVRVLEEENQQLARTVDGLKHRMQVLCVHSLQHGLPCVSVVGCLCSCVMRFSGTSEQFIFLTCSLILRVGVCYGRARGRAEAARGSYKGGRGCSTAQHRGSTSSHTRVDEVEWCDVDDFHHLLLPLARGDCLCICPCMRSISDPMPMHAVL